MTPQPVVSRTPDRRVVLLVLVLAVVVVGPLLRPGYVLRADMSVTPRQWLVPDAWGVGSAAPRAVPIDALMAMLTAALAGEWVQKVALLAIPLVAGVGVARLLPGRPTAQAVAAALYVWSPFLAERLLLGHWTYLLASAALPWLLAELLDLRRGRPGAGARAVLWLALCSLTPGGGLLALILGACVLLSPWSSVRVLGAASVAWALVNAPWWLPGVLRDPAPDAAASASSAVDVFAAQSDTPLGVLGSLLTSGAVWNADAVPASRASAVWVPLTCLLLILAGAGVAGLWSLWDRAAAGVALAACTGLVLALWGAVWPSSLSWLVAEVPAAGLLRDGQRFVVLWWLVCCVAIGLGTSRLVARLPAGVPRAAFIGGSVLVPLVALPDLALGVAGRLAPVRYPPDWDAVRAVVAAAPDHGDVVSVPFQPYRRFPWNDLRPQLDPAPRYLSSTVVVSRDLTVSTDDGQVTVVGDDPRSAEVGLALAAADSASLARLGIGWILVDDSAGEPAPEWVASTAQPAWRGDDLTLYRLPRARPSDLPPWAAAVVIGDVLAAGLVVVAAVGAGSARRAATLPEAKGSTREQA